MLPIQAAHWGGGGGGVMITLKIGMKTECLVM